MTLACLSRTSPQSRSRPKPANKQTNSEPGTARRRRGVEAAGLLGCSVGCTSAGGQQRQPRLSPLYGVRRTSCGASRTGGRCTVRRKRRTTWGWTSRRRSTTSGARPQRRRLSQQRACPPLRALAVHHCGNAIRPKRLSHQQRIGESIGAQRSAAVRLGLSAPLRCGPLLT